MYSVELGRKVVYYLVSIGVPFMIARKIEINFWKNASPELIEEIFNRKKLQESDQMSNEKIGSKVRRGLKDRFIVWLARVIMRDFARKVLLAAALNSDVWSELANYETVKALFQHTSNIIAAPGKKFTGFGGLFRRIKRIKRRRFSCRIKEENRIEAEIIKLMADLTTRQKFELLKIKIWGVLQNIFGSRREQLAGFVLGLIIFLFTGNRFLYIFSLERLRALLRNRGVSDIEIEAIIAYLIKLYRQHNAPIPVELSPFID